MNKLLIAMMAAVMASTSAGQERSYEPTPDTSDIGGGYHHEGIYSKQKKLRKGFGHKKLTRAQRKKLGGRKK